MNNSPPEADTNLRCSNLRKVNILLQAIESLGKDVEYYAVDLSLPELERTFAEIPTSKKNELACRHRAQPRTDPP